MRPAAQECVSFQAAPAPQCCKWLQFTVSSGQQCCWDTSVIPDFLSRMSPVHCSVAILTVKWRNGILKALLSCIPGQPLDSTNNCKTKRTFLCILCIYIQYFTTTQRGGWNNRSPAAFMRVSLFWAPCPNDESSTRLSILPPPLWELWSLLYSGCFLYILHISSQPPNISIGRGALHRCRFYEEEIDLPTALWETHLRSVISFLPKILDHC